jgi:23S rRNA-/tRNA-specific pseudouridylate synthase
MPVERIIKEEYIIDDLSLSNRLDKYASEHLESIPTKKCGYKLIKKGHLLLNGKQVSPEHRVSVGDKITLFEDVTDRPVFNLKLTVHFESEHCAVIEKVPGYPVMGNLYRSIENALSFNLKESQCADKLSYPKPVHRLDSPTGGLLLIAKTASALRNLSSQFQMRKIQKSYHAIVSGQLPLNGEIRNPIEGRDAHTVYQRLDCSRSWRPQGESNPCCRDENPVS